MVSQLFVYEVVERRSAEASGVLDDGWCSADRMRRRGARSFRRPGTGARCSGAGEVGRAPALRLGAQPPCGFSFGGVAQAQSFPASVTPERPASGAVSCPSTPSPFQTVPDCLQNDGRHQTSQLDNGATDSDTLLAIFTQRRQFHSADTLFASGAGRHSSRHALEKENDGRGCGPVGRKGRISC